MTWRIGSRVVVGVSVFAAGVAALIAANVAGGVPLGQSLRMFADNSYSLYVQNDTDQPVTLSVGFAHDILLVGPHQTKWVDDEPDETSQFPVRVTKRDGTQSTCFPNPFYQGAYPGRTVVVQVSQTRTGAC